MSPEEALEYGLIDHILTKEHPAGEASNGKPQALPEKVAEASPAGH